MKTILALSALVLIGCGHAEPPLPTGGATLTVTSGSFGANQEIPGKFSKEGGNVSPSLSWSRPPSGTLSMVVIVDDPDAPGSSPFVHWVVFNIDPSGSIEEGKAPSGAVEGVNGAGEQGYFGPKPPSGTHHYFFHVFALDAKLSLSAGASKADVAAAMKGHVLASGAMIGLFRHQ